MWLLINFTFNLLRSSFLGGHFPLEDVFIWRIYKIWFGLLSLSLKYEYDPMNGCCDIPLLIFWGHLPSKVVFHRRLSSIGGRLPLEVVFYWRSSSIRGRLPLEVVFHLRSSAIWGRLPLEFVFHWRLSSYQTLFTFNFKIWERSNHWLLRYYTFNTLRLSSIGGRLPLEVIFISSYIYFGFNP